MKEIITDPSKIIVGCQICPKECRSHREDRVNIQTSWHGPVSVPVELYDCRQFNQTDKNVMFMKTRKLSQD
jgi:hypothetical protein